MAMASSPYAVDRSRLTRRGRGIVPVLEQKQRQRLQSSTTSRPGSANIPMPQMSQFSQLSQLSASQPSDQEHQEHETRETPRETPRFVASPGDSTDGDRDPEAPELSPLEPQTNEETMDAVHGEMGENEAGEGNEKDEHEKWTSQEEVKEPACRLPKPTEVSQGTDGKVGAPRAKSAGKSGTLSKSAPMPGQAPGISKPKRTRSAEKPQKFVLAQPARRIPQRVPTSPETRDIASSPMSPISPMPGNTLQSESISGLFRELGILREDFIAAKLDSERAREKIQELEGENSQLKRQLQEAEKLKRKLVQQKQDLEHSGNVWRQRWEDSQQQLEECWKRFDALKVVKEATDAKEAQEVKEVEEVKEVNEAKEVKEVKEVKDVEQPGRKNSETFSQSSVEPSPRSGACQVELSSPHEPPRPPMAAPERREVQDPPVAVEVTSVTSTASEASSRAQPKAVTQTLAPSGACGAPVVSGAQVHSIHGIQGFQTPPVSGFPPTAAALSPVSPRTLPARTTFPSPRTQQALRVVSVPAAAANVYFSSQLPAQAGSPIGDYRRQSVPVVYTTTGSLPNTVIQSPRVRTAL